ncbi:uncharacterized protein [Phaseolus vulgaris]|uniref:uncharacterized protein n=1 Tax=Phaseolus vulgaris TaxID=3885 RepID=UPI0035C96426
MLKEFVNLFGAQMVRVNTTDDSMIVHAFRKGICPGPFSELLIRCRPKTFAEINEEHASVIPACPRAPSCAQPMRVNKVATGKRGQGGKWPFEPRKPQAKGRSGENKPVKHNFVVELKDLIFVPNIADRLKMPVKTDKVLGPHKDAWCEFHQAFPINSCLALGHQLDELVKSGFLNDYLARPSGTEALTASAEGQAHEMPIHGEISTPSQVDSRVEAALSLSARGMCVR